MSNRNYIEGNFDICSHVYRYLMYKIFGMSSQKDGLIATQCFYLCRDDSCLNI